MNYTPDPYDNDPRAPWNAPEPEPLGMFEEADFYEELYGDE
jgi:hypothetical protein